MEHAILFEEWLFKIMLFVLVLLAFRVWWKNT